MDSKIDREMGEQPLAKIMQELALKPKDLVANSGEQITHKMVSRAVKGRRLNPWIQVKILNALNKAAGKSFVVSDIFSY